MLPEYEGKLVIIQRGNCTFLEKAQHAHHARAKVLAIVNSEDKIEAVASGLGIDANITAAMVSPLDKFPIVSFSPYYHNFILDKLIQHILLSYSCCLYHLIILSKGCDYPNEVCGRKFMLSCSSGRETISNRGFNVFILITLILGYLGRTYCVYQ